MVIVWSAKRVTAPAKFHGGSDYRVFVDVETDLRRGELDSGTLNREHSRSGVEGLLHLDHRSESRVEVEPAELGLGHFYPSHHLAAGHEAGYPVREQEQQNHADGERRRRGSRRFSEREVVVHWAGGPG
jgi:hypothetical protein